MLTLDPPAAAGPTLRQAAAPPRTPLSRLRHYRRSAWRLLTQGSAEALRRAHAGWLFARARAKLRRLPQPWRLCLGSGSAPVKGFVNIDLDGEPDLRLDLRAGLPCPDASVAAVYSEHFIEHLPLDAVMHILRESRRVLRDDGVLRVATPDLCALLAAYGDDWRNQAWLQHPGFAHVDTRAHMLNLAFHGWGHHYLFDADDLTLRLQQAGFARVVRCGLGESEHAHLRGLETRADSLLVLEASGRAAMAARTTH